MDIFTKQIETDKQYLLPTDETIRQKGIDSIYTVEGLDIENANVIELSETEFFEYCNKHNIKELFVVRKPIDIDNYYIDECTVRQIKKGISTYDEKIESFSSLWNTKLESITEEELDGCGLLTYIVNDNKNFVVISSYSYDPILIHILKYMPGLINREDISGSTILGEFTLYIYNDFKEEMDEINKNRLMYVKDLMRYILTDTEFYTATNKELRGNYADRLVHSELYKTKYEKYLKCPNLIGNNPTYRMVENLYNLYKVVIKQSNRKLGELPTNENMDYIIENEHTFEDEKWKYN